MCCSGALYKSRYAETRKGSVKGVPLKNSDRGR